MRARTVLRQRAQDVSDQEKRRNEARKEIQGIKKSVLNDKARTAFEDELPEHDALITKHHLRHARRVTSAGRRLGATIDRLPIHHGSRPYRQKDARRPRSVEFEGTLLVLIERHGLQEIINHFSMGQHQKYELIVDDGTGLVVGVWNSRVQEREYPPLTVAEKLSYLIHHAMDRIE